MTQISVERQSKLTGIASAATLIAVGNVASRLLGLVRETTIAYLFGATGLVSAFDVASRVPRMLFDFLIDGMISSALVPVFSELAERDRDELWRVASILLCLATVLLGIGLLVMELLAPQIVWLMSSGFRPELLDYTARLLRLTAPAVVFLGLSGITTGLLYALKRFTLPAFTSATFNATIVVVAFILAKCLHWGVESLALGMVLGAAMQVVVQLPGLRHARLLPNLDWRHPGIRRILRLYAPVVAGLIVSQIGIVIDRNLASHTGEQSIAWMRYATTLVQFPLGLVSAAIAMAILPTLSRMSTCSADGDARSSATGTIAEGRERYMRTLTTGLKMVLLLILPAVAFLYALSEPVVAIIFQHGDFSAADTVQTATALRLYLLGTAFAAIDLPLVFAFYARQNTLTPALVGVAGVALYLVAALLPTVFRPLRMTDLVLANSVQLTGHAVVMLWLTHRFGSLRDRGLGTTAAKTLLAAVAAGAATAFCSDLLQIDMGAATLVHRLAIVGAAGATGLSVYVASGALLRIEGVSFLLITLRSKIGGPARD